MPPSAPGPAASRKTGSKAANLETPKRVLTNAPDCGAFLLQPSSQLSGKRLVRQNTSSYIYPIDMSDGPQGRAAGGNRMNTSAGHLSLHVDSAHAADFEFSFDREPKR